MTPRRALGILIVVSTAIRLVWGACLGPGNDEAYHYLFAVHPDWSYFDHPPMLALVETVGLALTGGVGHATIFNLRLGFILLFAGSTWLMWRLTSRFYSEWAGFFAAFALNVSAYHTAAAGAFALPDGPLLFFWLLTLDRLAVALERPERLMCWIGVGLAWGGALLSKYHAIFLPAGMVLYLLLDRSRRRILITKGPYLAVFVGLLVFSPVLFWNATHHWASFAFQSGRAIGGGFRPDALLGAIFLPGLYLFPWIWLALLWVAWRKLKGIRTGTTRPEEAFLLAEAIVPLGVFLGVAITKPVLPHWTLVGFLPLFPMLGAWFETIDNARPSQGRRRLVVLAMLPLVCASLLVLEARFGWLQKGRPGGLGLIAASQDPTAEMAGWDVIADELRKRNLLDRPDTFLFTTTWYHSGQLAFSTRHSQTPVLCYHPWDARSFAFWSKPADWVGRDGILVALNQKGSAGDAERYERWFRKIEPIGEFEVVRQGTPIRQVRLYRCVAQTDPFPFDDLGSTIKPKPRNKAAVPEVAVPDRDRLKTVR